MKCSCLAINFSLKSNSTLFNVLAKKFIIDGLNESKRKKSENILKKYPDAVIADVTGHPCGIGENMGDFVPLSGYHFTLSEGMESKCGHCRNG